MMIRAPATKLPAPARHIANELRKMHILRELIAKEERSGNKIAEAVYRVRFVRIAQVDVYKDLAVACRLLNEGGMGHSARFVATLILDRVYKGSEKSVEFAAKFLAQEKTEDAGPIQETIVLDNRESPGYELSCIVSIFREGQRAVDCLKRIADQSLYKAGKLEIIFVDSHSPANEEELFRRDHSRMLHFLYLKTSRTETLAAAWNRGARHSMSELVTFTAPSNYFTENAFEILLRPFHENGSIVLTQGDIGELNAAGVPPVSINKADLRRITVRRDDEVQQVVPFFFINYLAFDCCVVKKRIFEEIGGFDASYICAAENKLHLNVLTKGPIQQIGEVIEGAFEEKGPRLTVNPRIEIEHFQAIYEAAGAEALLQSARQDPTWKKKSDETLMKDLISLSLKYRTAYPEKMKYRYYDLEKARSIAQLGLLKFPDKGDFWTDSSLLDMRCSINRVLLFQSYAAELDNRGSAPFMWNIAIIRLVRWLLSITVLSSHPRRIRETWTSGLRSKNFGSIVRKCSRLIARNKTISPDINGETIW